MNDESGGERVAFEVDGSTLSVRDVIEGNRLRLRVDREPSLSPALPELFPLPVDDAVSFEAESLAIPEYASVAVRDVDGDHVAWLDEPMDLPRGSYVIEVNGATKALVRVTDVEIAADGVAGPNPVSLSFDRPRTVSVGARSLHTRPEATITVPDDPAALAEAVSVLGSSIKEFTPERSWPTLRGYPPRIERGDALDIPSPLTVPDTGVEVVVRPTHADVYRLSTLSYYLGAQMTIGERPAIRLDTGYEETLPTDGRALEERVTELLKTWFFLDTLARTEGYVPSDRYEYESVGPSLPFYPPNLADRSMDERLMEYLEVALETVAPYLPAWPTEAVLRPIPESAELLPHLAHVLASVRVRGDGERRRADAPAALATTSQVAAGPSTFAADAVPIPDADSVPAGTAVLTPASYENYLDREVTDRGRVSAAFLLGNAERSRSVRESLTTPTDADGIGSWSLYADPDSETVAEVLSDPTIDVVFCGLPLRDGRVEVADGAVDVTGLSTGSSPTAPTLSIFESPSAVTAGIGAVERGGVAAVALEGRVDSERLRTFVSLLACGTPLAVATDLALDGSNVDARYVGDPATNVATDRAMAAHIINCLPVGEDSFRVLFSSFSSSELTLGQEISLTVDPLDPATTLVGAPERTVGFVNASDVVEFHQEEGPIVQLADDFVFRRDPLSVEDLVDFAQKEMDSNVPSERAAEQDWER